MKHLWAIITAMCMTTGILFAAEGEVRWLTNMPEAQKIAATEKKDLLVNFTGSDWCTWCIRLKKEVFSQPEFAAVSKEFVFVELDFPRNISQTQEVKRANQELAEKYAIEGYPTVLLMNAKGEVYAKTGYKAGGAAGYVKQLLELKKNKLGK